MGNGFNGLCVYDINYVFFFNNDLVLFLGIFYWMINYLEVFFVNVNYYLFCLDFIFYIFLVVLKKNNNKKE